MIHAIFFRSSAVVLATMMLSAAGIVAAADGPGNHAGTKLVVHEWGTFTSLQDENGKALGGINVDDEPLPPFVHNLNSYVLGLQHVPHAAFQMKGVPPKHPYVTLRLETPVIYFYPPASQTTPLVLNVDVHFNGGWLTQFYPQAKGVAPGLNPDSKQNSFNFGPIDRDTVSLLSWNNLQVGTGDQGPKTSEPVWITPRNVTAAQVSTADGESERYLFYRGVGNIDSPLSVADDLQTGTLSLRSRFADVLAGSQTETIPAAWLVHIRGDGATAYRAMKPLRVSADPKSVVATIRSTFDKTEYSRQNLDKLRREMHAALVTDGLFDEEATAMLQTWQKSYFASGGLRLFYVVPRRWTDHYLPLTISQPADITRVMVARTELISPEQLQLLSRLAAGPVSDPNWINTLHNDNPEVRKFMEGHSGFGDLGVPIPPDYQTYLDLGRFRNALVLYEQAGRKAPALSKFIANYDLQQFPVADNRTATVSRRSGE